MTSLLDAARAELKSRDGPTTTLLDAAKAELASRESESPQAEISNAPSEFIQDTTYSASRGLEDDNRLYAPIGTRALSSLPKDPINRAKIYAQHYLPGVPEDVALGMMGNDRGRIYILRPNSEDEGSQGFYVEPDTFWQAPAKWVAGAAGESIPAVTSAAGGLAGSLLGPGGSVAGSVAGGVGGDVIRQTIAGATTGEEYDPMQTATEGALSVGGEVAGQVFSRLGRAIKQIETNKYLNDAQRQAKVQELLEEARRQDIELTPAEATNLRTLRAQQRVLQDSAEAADTLDDFYQSREAGVAAAVDRSIAGVSTAATDPAKIQFRDAASEVIDLAVTARSDTAQPLFEQAFTGDVSVNAINAVAELSNTAARSRAGRARTLNKIFQEFKEFMTYDESGRIIGVDVPLRDLHEIREVVRGAIDDLGPDLNSATKRAKRDLERLNRKLGLKARASSSDYGVAMDRFIADSGPIDDLKKGIVGAVARRGEVTIEQITGVVFRASPDQVGAAREAFVSAGKEAEWNGMVAAYLSDTFEIAAKEMQSVTPRAGAKFHKAVFSTRKARDRLRNALPDAQTYKGFEKLMSVLKATGAVPEGGSMTAFNQLVTDKMNRTGVNVALNAVQALSKLDITAGLATFARDLSTARHQRLLADAIVSPDGMKMLKELSDLSPTSRRARIMAGQFIVRFGYGDRETRTEVPQ